MPTQAHIFVESKLVRQKDQGALDQLQGQLTQSGLAVSFRKSRPHHSLFQKAKLVARDKAFSEQNLPIVVIGNEGSRNEVLSGFLAVDENKKHPILLVSWPEKGGHIEALISQIMTSLAAMQIKEAPVGLISGDVPSKGQRYFLDYVQVGQDFSALLPKFDQKFAIKEAWRQFLNFWNFLSSNQNALTFGWTLRHGRTYQHFSKTLGMQILNNGLDEKAETEAPYTIRLVNQVPWPKIFLTYFQGKKGRQNPSRRGFLSFDIKEQADIHVRDIQSVKTDGRPLDNGAYTFTLSTWGTYPLIEAVQVKPEGKHHNK
ncbi:hypothetical protein G6R29_04195 [Fructobacillus sp. M2-14]|uniref:Uncharacterized protein n=1 Tax=Fructobacillus broussonetiae TaxID=2713173 RepID=A0ABS5R051_9LACO|nr:hypothetical protein [Fructobacillus broussonetiae]MBS9338824.1 hypothetical protein [Fructobacillus broussonetiae]